MTGRAEEIYASDYHLTKLNASGTRVGLYPISGTSWANGMTLDDGAGLAFDGTHIWISHKIQVDGSWASFVLKLRASDGAVVGDYPTGHQWVSNLFFDGTHIWTIGTHIGPDITNTYPRISKGFISKLRTSDGAVIAAYPTPSQSNPEGYPPGGGSFQNSWPTHMVSDGTYLWVNNTADSYILKLRTSDGEITDTYYVGHAPDLLAFDGSHIWTHRTKDNEISRWRVSDGMRVNSYSIGEKVLDMLFDGTYIWASGSSGDVFKLRAFDSPC